MMMMIPNLIWLDVVKPRNTTVIKKKKNITDRSDAHTRLVGQLGCIRLIAHGIVDVIYLLFFSVLQGHTCHKIVHTHTRVFLWLGIIYDDDRVHLRPVTVVVVGVVKLISDTTESNKKLISTP